MMTALRSQAAGATNELESRTPPEDLEHRTAVPRHRGESPDPTQWGGYPPADGGDRRIVQCAKLREFGAQMLALCALLQELRPHLVAFRLRCYECMLQGFVPPLKVG